MATTECTELGLKCGIEIHQQLDTHKLFCSCPSMIRDDEPDVVFQRRLRASAGETGEVDIAAALEQKKQKYFLYKAYIDTTCLVEYDCEPIHSMNSDALRIGLQVALMLHANIVDRIQVMRKTVVDGSNTAGFQRTALIATDGYLETTSGRISIPTICIEEEAAKIIERTPEYDAYNLSRLGIPLIEIGTGPDITTPEQAREVAENLGMILRSTGRVKRGLGTIRQDVNISIKGGNRVEVKGAQDLRSLPLIVSYECQRQKGLLDIMGELNKRKARVKDNITDISSIMKKSNSTVIKSALESGTVLAARLDGFAGLLGRELLPGRRFGTELSDYAKVYGGVGGIFHSDELPKYGIIAEEVAAIRKKLSCRELDAFVIVAAEKIRARAAIDAVIERAKTALKEIPKEVRKANEDATTSFMRPIPGAARMYPETDCPTIAPDTKGIVVPKLIVEKAKDYEQMGLSKDLAALMSKSGKQDFFENMIEKNPNVEAQVIANTLLQTPKEIKTRFNLDASKLTDKLFEELFDLLNKGEISKNAILEILVDAAKTGKLNSSKYKKMPHTELKAEIRKIVSENKGAPLQAMIGIVMGRLRGKADGKEIVEIVKEVTANP